MTTSVPEREFAEYFKRAMHNKLPDLVERQPRLRVSGFPFCGLKAAYMKMAGYVGEDGDSLKEFYCDVGTAAHTVFQRSLGSLGKIYGDWKCRDAKCGTITHFSRRNKCPKCGKEMEYVEFEVTAYRHVSGHTDGVYRDLIKQAWAIDYKTSSMRVLNYQKSNPTLPYRKNVQQIEAYVPMLEEKLNIEIRGWLLGYVPRDDPKVIKVTGVTMSDRKKASVMKRIKLYDDQYHEVLNLNSAEQLDYLKETKFCKNYEHYLRDMKGFKGCPLEGVCFTKQLGPVLDMALDEYTEKL